jgi:hypothetical protein
MSLDTNKFASADLTAGQLNDIVEKLGGYKEALRFLGGELAENHPLCGSIFRLMLWGNMTTEKLVQLGKYQWPNGWITDERFPLLQHDPIGRVVEYVEFDHDPTSDEVLAEFSRRGLERPTYEDALYFGIMYFDEQMKSPVVFLHEPVRYRVLVLYKDLGKRGMRLRFFKNRWNRRCMFAGIRKPS